MPNSELDLVSLFSLFQKSTRFVDLQKRLYGTTSHVKLKEKNLKEIL